MSPRPSVSESDLYGLYDELDRLEELLEDMASLQVRSVADIEDRIAELNARIDAIEDESGR
ncbi:MAG: hypothetical protein R2839_02385 [Thermomicrobiales bacterium]